MKAPCTINLSPNTSKKATRAPLKYIRHVLSESSCLGLQLEPGGKIHPKLNIPRETDSEQVPRGKDEKYFEKRVKERLKWLRGKRWPLEVMVGHLIWCLNRCEGVWGRCVSAGTFVEKVTVSFLLLPGQQ